MSKRLTFLTLTVTGFAGLGVAIWQYRRHWEWLNTHGADGAALLGLFFLGILALMTPLDFRSRWEKVTLARMIRDFFVRGGLMVALVLGIVGLFLGIAWIGRIQQRAERPYFLLPLLILLIPLAITLIDIVQGNVRRTLINLIWGYVLYSFQAIYLLLIQFATIPIAFVLFPAGFFLQLISIVEGGIRLFSSGTPDSLPVLCEWFNVDAAVCAPALVTFHIGHLVLALLAAKYGERLLDKASDGYANGMEWLAGHIKK
jgi:hypothetical protein